MLTDSGCRSQHLAEAGTQLTGASATKLTAGTKPSAVDDAQQRGQLSAAIQAEVKRGELRRFYVKQVETGDAGEFERMSDKELRAYVNGEKLPPKGETKH
jgi:hypothetical protein